MASAYLNNNIDKIPYIEETAFLYLKSYCESPFARTSDILTVVILM